MAYEQVGGSKIYRPWVGWQVGDSFEGIHTGTHEDNYGKTNWEFETVGVEFEEEVAVVIPTKGKRKGEEVEYTAPKVGEIFVLNSSGSLDKAMEKVDIGDKVKVIYEGTIILNSGPNKGSQAHQMRVFRDPSGNNKKVSTTKAEVDKLAKEQEEDDSESAL